VTSKTKDKLIEVAVGFIAALLLGIIVGSMTGCDESMTGTRKVVMQDDIAITEINYFQGNKYCGDVIHFKSKPLWQASAYNDYSRNLYFNSEAEAEGWLTTNWCKP
jgi:hypothetical protein